MKTCIQFTIAIATCDRPERLGNTLRAIREAVDAGGGGHALVVADNGAKRPSKAVVDDFARSVRFPVRHLPCSPRDRCRALNTAVRAVETDWIAFTDDDTLPDRGWLAEATAYAQRGECRIFGGRIAPGELERPLPAWMNPGRSGRASSHVVLVRYDPRPASGLLGVRDPVPFGANLFIRKELFDQYGPFDESLYPLLGRAALGGDDTEFEVRVRSKGEAIGYCREAVVVHPVHHERACVREQVRLAWAFGRREPFVYFDPDRPWLEPYRVAQLARWSVRAVADLGLGDRAGVVDDLLKISRCCGEMAGRWSRAYRMKKENIQYPKFKSNDQG